MNTSKTIQPTAAQMTTGSVTSADGTMVGYLRTGQGPAVVLLHGSNESARSHLQLARALASRFTVYLPGRDAHHGTSQLLGWHNHDRSLMTRDQPPSGSSYDAWCA